MTGRAFFIAAVVCVAVLGVVWFFSTGGLTVTADPVDCNSGPLAETSSDYLQRQAHCIYAASDLQSDKLRLALIDDIYIKSWAYALLNKVCFWLSIGLAILVLVYPALGPILTVPKPEGEETPPNWFQRAISTSSVQTSLTALAAASFAFYAHYKERQSVAETLMRQLLVKEIVDVAYMEDVVNKVAQMDKGFGFASTAASE